MRVASNLLPGVGAGLIAAADYQAIWQTIAVCSDTVASIGRAPDTWGVIHNDLHPATA